MCWQVRWTPLVVLALWVVPAGAQTVADALAAVPKEALGFALINKLSEADEKLQELGKQLSIKSIQKSVYQELKQKLGLERGINDQGALLAVLLPVSTSSEPCVALYVPTSDYPQLLRELKAKPVRQSKGVSSFTALGGNEMVIGQRGAFAVLLPKENEKELIRLLEDQGAGAEDLKSLKNWLQLNQLSGVLTARGIKWASENIIKQIDEIEKTGLRGAPNELGDVISAFCKPLREMVRTLENDFQGAGFGIRLDAAGNLRLTGRGLLVSQSGLSRLAAEVRVPPGGLLTDLPARSFALAFGAALPPRLTNHLMEFGNTLQSLGTKGLLSADLQKRMQEAYRQASKDVEGVALLIAVPRKGEALLSGIISLVRTKNVHNLLRATEKYSKLQGEALDEILQKSGAGIQIPVKVTNHQLPEGPAVETILDLSAVAGMLPPQVTDIFQSIFGSADKIHTTAVAINKQTVVSVLAPPKKVKKVLTNDEGQSELPDTVRVAKLLPQNPQIIGYLSPHGVMALVRQVLDALPLPMAIPLPEMPRTPPVALAVHFGESQVEGEILVPAATLTGLGQFIRSVMDMVQK